MDTVFVALTKAELITALEYPLPNKVILWNGADGVAWGNETVNMHGNSRVVGTGIAWNQSGDLNFHPTVDAPTVNRIQWELSMSFVTPASPRTIDNNANSKRTEHWFKIIHNQATSYATDYTWNITGGTNPLRYEQVNELRIWSNFAFINWFSPNRTKVVAGVGCTVTENLDQVNGNPNIYTVNVTGGSKPSLTKTLTLESPTGIEDMTIFRTDVAITVQEVLSVSTGTSPSTTFTLRHSTDRDSTGNLLSASTASTNKTTGQVSTLSDATIPADSWIWLETTAASGTGVIFSVDIRFTED